MYALVFCAEQSNNLFILTAFTALQRNQLRGKQMMIFSSSILLLVPLIVVVAFGKVEQPSVQVLLFNYAKYGVPNIIILKYTNNNHFQLRNQLSTKLWIRRLLIKLLSTHHILHRLLRLLRMKVSNKIVKTFFKSFQCLY